MTQTLTTVCLAALVATTALAADLHDPWDALLQAHVQDGWVDYRGFRKDEAKLDAYLGALAKTDLSKATRNERLAFWINAYNAFTIQLILDHYPLESIRNIENPWKGFRHAVAGEDLTLDKMEHVKLRAELKEPRIHFAIVCASIGCPDLWNRAYRAETLDEELDAATRKFVGSDKHVRTETKRGLLSKVRNVLYASRIFKWFGGDFTAGGTRTVADFIVPYVDPATANFIRSAGKDLQVEYLGYDWSLNER